MARTGGNTSAFWFAFTSREAKAVSENALPTACRRNSRRFDRIAFINGDSIAFGFRCKRVLLRICTISELGVHGLLYVWKNSRLKNCLFNADDDITVQNDWSDERVSFLPCTKGVKLRVLKCLQRRYNPLAKKYSLYL